MNRRQARLCGVRSVQSIHAGRLVLVVDDRIMRRAAQRGNQETELNSTVVLLEDGTTWSERAWHGQWICDHVGSVTRLT